MGSIEQCFFCKQWFFNLEKEENFLDFKKHNYECARRHNRENEHNGLYKAHFCKVLKINGRRAKIWECRCIEGKFRKIV